jgi:hypothetical protein
MLVVVKVVEVKVSRIVLVGIVSMKVLLDGVVSKVRVVMLFWVLAVVVKILIVVLLKMVESVAVKIADVVVSGTLNDAVVVGLVNVLVMLVVEVESKMSIEKAFVKAVKLDACDVVLPVVVLLDVLALEPAEMNVVVFIVVE